MNVSRPVGLAFGAVEASCPEILPAIAEPGIAAAIWRRPRDAGFADWIEDCPAGCLPRLAILTTPGQVERAVRDACDRAGTPKGPHRDRLASDAAALALILSHVADQPLIKLRLEVVENDMCRKFHMDMVRCRLLCTYRGPGTEYGAATPGGTNVPDRIHRLEAADAAIFRGAMWPGPEFSGVLHRSPPMKPGDPARLLLAIDPVDAVEGHC